MHRNCSNNSTIKFDRLQNNLDILVTERRTDHQLCAVMLHLRLLPTILGTLVYNIFRQIYHLDESKQLIMINQRLDQVYETTKNNFQIDVAMTTMTFLSGCQFASNQK